MSPSSYRPDDPHLPARRDDDVRLPSLRDLVHPLFRYRRSVVATFVFACAAVAMIAFTAGRTYTAEMKILVKRERLDPIVTSEQQAPFRSDFEVHESELLAEVELLTGRDVLEQVVKASGLIPRADGAGGAPSPAQVSRALASVRANLDVAPIHKTPMISVRYRSADPQLAARVLEQLATLYLARHLAVHRPAGAHQFFSEQMSRSKEVLHESEARLRAFTEREQVVSPEAERESTLAKLSEFEATMQETEAAIADATRRMSAVEDELARTPARQVTQISNNGNLEMIRALKSQVLALEIRRTDLLRKFRPQYPAVVQVETELRQLRHALNQTEEMPLTGEVTDQNPTHQWLRNEAVRVRTERDALTARGEAVGRTITGYRARARRLDALTVEQQSLLRDVKAAQEDMALYQRKQEEARIADALDRTRIANVMVAEPPAIPREPRSRRNLILVMGGLASMVLSFGVAYLRHAFNPRFRTAEEVYLVLDVPVLASLPAAE
jgi:succinoglycan biosynthesis transport protein ExoP